MLKEEAKHISDPNKRQLAYKVATTSVKKIEVGGDADIVLIDCGVKQSNVTNLIEKN